MAREASKSPPCVAALPPAVFCHPQIYIFSKFVVILLNLLLFLTFCVFFFIQARRGVAALPPAVFCHPKKTLFILQARREVAALPPAVFCHPKKTLSILQAHREVAALPPAVFCHPKIDLLGYN